MLRIIRGKFKPGRLFDFVNFFKDEDKVRTLMEANPEGVEFLGAYVVSRGQADHDWELVWQISGYAVLDQMDFSNERIKIAMEAHFSEVGFYFTDVTEHFVRSVKEVVPMDEGLFKEIIAREKERAK